MKHKKRNERVISPGKMSGWDADYFGLGSLTRKLPEGDAGPEKEEDIRTQASF